MYKVIYYQGGQKCVDDIYILAEVRGYEEKTLEQWMWYECTIDENNIVVHAGYHSGWDIGEEYDD